jgi:drug/metabolite transporter (DMT)-like permease
MRTRTILAFGIVYVVWGSTYLGIKVALNEGMPPALMGGVRLLIAGAILLGVTVLRGKPLRISRRDLSTSAIVGLLLLCGGMFSSILSEQRIDSSLAAIVVAGAPLWMALAESVLPGMDRPTRRGLFGLVIGLVGMIVLVGPRIGGLSGTPSELIGIGIQMAGSWLWVTGSIISKKRPLTTDGVVATGYEMLIAGAVLTFLSLVLGEFGHVRITAAGVGAVLYLAVFGSAIALTSFMWLIRNVRGSTVMTYAYVNPAVAVVLGYLAGVVGLLPKPETLDIWSLTGTLVILGGVALATSAPSAPSHREPIAPSADEIPEAPAS